MAIIRVFAHTSTLFTRFGFVLSPNVKLFKGFDTVEEIAHFRDKHASLIRTAFQGGTPKLYDHTSWKHQPALI